MESGKQRLTLALQALLACPQCHEPVLLSTDDVECARCGTAISFRDGVVTTREFSRHSYFDKVFQVMREGNREEGTWRLFYQQQARYVTESLRSGEIVVDVGCGPELPYEKGKASVIGVDASFDSIRANDSVDLRIYASAAALPLRDGVADKIVCFYSVHHMTGSTVSENHNIVAGVFREFARVLKPAGRLLVFDVSPRWPFGAVEDISWNTARRLLGSGLDMYFWTNRRLLNLGKRELPDAAVETRQFGGSPFQTFPPIFSKPLLRVPRILYPFHICLYQWFRSSP